MSVRKFPYPTYDCSGRNRRAAFVISELGGHSDVAALALRLEIGMNDISKNDLRGIEAMLYSQAQVLHAVFVDCVASGEQA